jgi:predicted DNA-binding transcriptional regulator AlpA
MTAAPTLAQVRKWPATVSVHDAALALGVSTSAAYDWIKTGEFPCKVLTVRSRTRVITADLVRLLSQTEAVGAR